MMKTVIRESLEPSLADLPYVLFERLRDVLAHGEKLKEFGEMETPSTERDIYLDQASSDFARIFFAHDGRVVNKWLHYLDVYDRHLSRFRDTDVRVLEIGVYMGGSLQILRKYLGAAATIFGIDINPECASRVDEPNKVRIGSQDDEAFLSKVVEELGGVDVIIDDGSHIAGHQRTSFSVLFPLLSNDGIYILEDLHTAYWPGLYRGGLKRPGTAIEMLKEMIDDMHRSYHRQNRPSHGDLGGLHVYDSIAVVEKKVSTTPRRMHVPNMP
jgi:hypothetical protein